MNFKSLTFAAAGAILASGCNAAKNGQSTSDDNHQEAVPQLVGQPMDAEAHQRGTASFMPKAVAYRMSGPYADNVPVELNAAGDIVSYPDPTDLSATSAPIDLGDGWWLDRRGVSENSVFTRYTYSEYRALSQTPSIAELKAAILPDARVTQTYVLPMTTQQAASDLAAAKAELPVFRLKK